MDDTHSCKSKKLHGSGYINKIGIKKDAVLFSANFIMHETVVRPWW
jgi:hypothetical protein